MKRLLHALAVLWPGRKIPLRTGPAACESRYHSVHRDVALLRPQISEYAIKSESAHPQISASALKKKTIFHLDRRYCNVLACMTLFMCLIAAFKAPAQTGAAASMNEIQPLQIGDTIPEELWHLPLQVVNHPDGKETITLNDYRGKLIILDFWATWCSSCIATMPKMSNLQNDFRDNVMILPVTHADVEAVTNFRKRNTLLQNLKLTYIVSDTLLNKLFSHITIPHLVWIDVDSKLISTTDTDPVEAQNISHVLRGGTPYWKPKIDVKPLDKGTPIIQIDTPEYYSSLGTYQAGMVPKVIRTVDTLRGTDRWTAVNLMLYELILFSHRQHNIIFPLSYVDWQVHDRSRYIKPLDIYTREWNEENRYCYESRAPIHGTPWQEVLKEDLKRYFPGLETSLDSGEHECFVLVRRSQSEKIRPNTEERLLQVHMSDSVKIIRNYPVNNLVNLLNKNFIGTPVFDGTGYKEMIDISLPVDDLSSVVDVRKALQAYDLDLVADRRPYIRLLIRDQSYTFQYRQPLQN